MLHLFAGLDLHTGLLLLLALAFVLFYEAINGFHDTANAVATVIYTRAMVAVLWRWRRSSTSSAFCWAVSA
jgi:low-affinity inorganic phosphate transporter